ncbi:hypothetical protein X729_02190 [Mesorhizobium sp. L103C131B0]|nr:hypothetical protein X729_02190 [Mesorhizobium sp. L103C131B0]
MSLETVVMEETFDPMFMDAGKILPVDSSEP